MDSNQLRFLVVRPVLEHIGLHSEAAENLVMGTAAQESRLKYIHQLGNGPAKGLFQMEPATHDDIWGNFLEYRDDTAGLVLDYFAGGKPDADQMVWNMAYACAMCRVHYLRVPEGLPAADDIDGLAAYWKEHYNTHLGAGTVEEFIENYDLVAM